MHYKPSIDLNNHQPLKIRKYIASDNEAVIKLLQANTPSFFAENEKNKLESYLENEVEDYFVVEENNQIIGAGGINYFPDEQSARITWDIISPDYQDKGIGSKLMRHRLDLLNQNNEIDLIIVRTSQLAHKFYEKQGFKLEKVEENFWAKDYDLYLMVFKKNT